jgi:hypothetical protein
LSIKLRVHFTRCVDVVRNRPLDERQVNMAMTNTKKWVRAHGLTLTTDQKLLLYIAVIADIKEARPTVRRKPPVQQPQPKTCPLCGCQLLVSKLDLLVCISNDCNYMYDAVKHRAVR